jgi:spore germination cell wall hydrolase CwlJ-like protein
MMIKKNAGIIASIALLFVIFAVYFTQTSVEKYETKQLANAVGSQFKKDLHCLAENIYYEAGGESFEGKLAVAQVTINRANSGKFPGNICSVVYQKTGDTYQFSWVGMSKYNKDRYRWEESQIVAKKALTEPVAHALLSKQNALYYHANYVNPKWKLQRVTQIGNHIFYKEKNGKIQNQDL